MVRRFCASGNNEGVKCAVHAAAGFIVAPVPPTTSRPRVYRRDRHLRINAVVYTLAVAWELKQTLHHLSALGDCDASTELKPAA